MFLAFNPLAITDAGGRPGCTATLTKRAVSFHRPGWRRRWPRSAAGRPASRGETGTRGHGMTPVLRDSVADQLQPIDRTVAGHDETGIYSQRRATEIAPTFIGPSARGRSLARLSSPVASAHEEQRLRWNGSSGIEDRSCPWNPNTDGREAITSRALHCRLVTGQYRKAFSETKLRCHGQPVRSLPTH